MAKKYKFLSSLLVAFLFLGVVMPSFAATTDIRTYIERPASENKDLLYHGVKYEPITGSYLGMFAEGDEVVHDPWTGNPFYFDGVPELTGRHHALYMIYLRYDEMNFNHYLSHYNKAKETNAGMQVCLEPMGGLESVVDGEYLHNFAKEAKESGIPIFLRFANEMNDGSNPWGNKDPELYKEKFRLVANIMHKEAPNVVMCWAPNDWPFNSSDKYYPGDDAVDWVGISCYPPYTSNTKSKHSMKFTDKTKEIYDKYVDRKPIFLSEGAPIQNIEFQTEASVSYVASKEIKEFYDEVARRYPGIKAIFYWNNDEPWGAIRQCKLSNNPTALAAYKKAISSPFFLSEVGQKSPIYFADVEKNTIAPENQKLSTFVAVNGRLDIGKVVYKLNGKYIGEAIGSPYEINYDFSNVEGQKITIDVDIYTTSDIYVTNKKMISQVTGNPQVKSTIEVKATPSKHSIKINGETAKVRGYGVEGYNYFILRDLAYALKDTNSCFDVDYDIENKKIVLTRNERYQGNFNSNEQLINNPQVSKNSQSILIDDKASSIMDAHLINGNNYFKLADLGKNIGFDLDWDGETQTIMITTN